MPKYGAFTSWVSGAKTSVYSTLAKRLQDYEGETYPLHIGDTFMEPAAGCRMEDFDVGTHPGMHRYSPVHGHRPLLERLAQHVSGRVNAKIEVENILVTAGATGGLGAIVGALVSPGEEVLILAPHWPLIAGIVRCFHGIPVRVPFFGEGAISTDEGIRRLEAHRTSKTVAVYINTPNNPTGDLLTAEMVAAIAVWSRDKGLWILSDEVYEEYVYGDKPHTYAVGFAPERTIACHSFSKSYGQAGNRAGYLVGPKEAIVAAKKVSTNTYYSAPTASQLAALAALDLADPWVANARAQYRDVGEAVATLLGVPSPQGSTFLFVDVGDHLDASGLDGFLSRCVERGLLIAPGPAFGPYPTHVRICFTSAEPERVLRGARVLAELMGRL
jgi:aspartate/methionine/tyrosine aminotransferase